MRTQPVERRSFFRRILGEATAGVDAMRGQPQHRLQDLRQLSDEQVGRLVPALDPERGRLDTTHGTLTIAWSTEYSTRNSPESSEQTSQSLQLDAAETRALEQFHGGEDLAQIATRVATELGLDPDETWVDVRHLFICLVERGLCSPVNPL